MTVSEVLAGVPLLSPLPPALSHVAISGLDYDSRRVKDAYLFFAFPGARVDGREFAGQAVDSGAVAVVSELPAPEGFSAPWIQVEHGRRALAMAAKAFYGKPDERIPLVGYYRDKRKNHHRFSGGFDPARRGPDDDARRHHRIQARFEAAARA